MVRMPFLQPVFDRLKCGEPDSISFVSKTREKGTLKVSLFHSSERSEPLIPSPLFPRA